MRYKRAPYREYSAHDLIELTAAPPSLTGEVEAEPGVLLANGFAVSRTKFAKLFAEIGTLYGVGDGATTFNLPDAKGRMIFGKADAGTLGTIGATPGVETHALATAELPAHVHTGFDTTGGNRTAGASGVLAPTTVNSSSAGSGTAHENRAPFQVVNYGVVYV